MEDKSSGVHLSPSVKKYGEGIAAIPMFEDESLLSPEQLAYRKNLEVMQECATLVGNLCFAWSGLELGLDKLIRGITAFPNNDVADTFLINIDARDKTRIAAGLGFLRKPSDEWFEILKWCLDQIDNDLRTRRNRFVHDLWHVSAQGIKQIGRKTGFRKPQANKELEYYIETERSTEAKDIQELLEDVQKMIFRLEFLWLAGRRDGARWRELIEVHAPIPRAK